MKFSEHWLREWMDINIDSNILIEKLTMIGLKVNSTEIVSNNFYGVIIGNIEKCTIHPKNHNLYINTVNIGKRNTINIISDAINCRINTKIVVAVPGAMIPINKIVKQHEIYGIISEGILCSFLTLGINFYNNHNLIELPENAPIGEDFRKYLHFDDIIIDISIPINRHDCYGLFGIARYISTIYKYSFQPSLLSKYVIPTINDIVSVNVQNTYACPYYLARIIKNININVNTPVWMKEKLRRSNVRSINILIDSVNYIFLEFGQIINIFDRNKIQNGINVRFAHHGEIFYYSNSQHILLEEDTLVIADHQKILTLAGIFCEPCRTIDVSTSSILIESAYFNPTFISGKLKKYNINTSYNEKNMDYTVTKLAIERITILLTQICGGNPGPIINNINTNVLSKRNYIYLQSQKLNKIIGFIIPKKKIKDILIQIGCIISYKQNTWKVKIPNWRYDIHVEENLIEEIIKLYGYNKIPNLLTYPYLQIPSVSNDILYNIKNILVSRDYQEIITYSFVNPTIQNLLYPQQKSLNVINPVSMEMSVMRTSLWTGLVKTLIYNQNRQQKRIRLFEGGLCFIPDINKESKIYQKFMISGIITGMRYNKHWNMINSLVDFYDIKGDIESIFKCINKLKFIFFKKTLHTALHPEQSAGIYLQDECIGFVGAIHPMLEKKLHLKYKTLVFELSWEKINDYKIPEISNVTKFPINRRDISMIISEEIPVESIMNECKQCLQEQLIDIQLLDIFCGKNIQHGFKSITISLFLQSKEHTLKEEEISIIVKQCVITLKNKFQILLRD